MDRPTRAPTVFGAILMLLGAGLYFVDISDHGRNPHWFVVPAVVLMGLGALFAVLGAAQRGPGRPSR
jgi:hypothetical protein